MTIGLERDFFLLKYFFLILNVVLIYYNKIQKCISDKSTFPKKEDEEIKSSERKEGEIYLK